MNMNEPEALVVGHLCLDVIPTFRGGNAPLSELFVPGKLIDVGNVVLSTGGAASNTGLALHRLGFKVGVVGKVGDDVFGRAVVDLLRQTAPHLAETMIVSPGDGTSYSVVLNPPGIDRIFLHSPGANDTFTAGDVPDKALAGARLMHFGYPPLMRRFQIDDGDELKTLFSRAKQHGLTTTLDMARPDPDSPAGKVDWVKFLENVLPVVDVFLPSVDEIIYMTDRPLFDALQKQAGDGNPAAYLDIETVRSVAEKMLSLGAGMVGFKLGDQGFYLRTSGDAARLKAMGKAAPDKLDEWLNQEIVTGCRCVEVAGTTGAGDCTIAGFLGSLLKGLSADDAVAMAVGVGGASVEARDSNSGVPEWDVVVRRLAAGWPGRQSAVAPADWKSTPAGNRARP